MPNRTVRILGVAMMMSLLGGSAACGTEVDPADDDVLGATTQSFDTATDALPQGLVCGLTHSTIKSSYGCDGVRSNKVAPGFRDVSDGDLGSNAGKGFRHQSLLANTQAAAAYPSDQLPLPRGTACGFKHTLNSPNERCMGYDAFRGCPPGWLQRAVGDVGGGLTGKGGWFWCEYEDPYVVCPDETCKGNVPIGTACGISYEPGLLVGTCEGYTGTCPPGWTRRGPRDEEAPAGQGIAWCEKAPPPIQFCHKTDLGCF